jgi:hypothetical protein
VSSISDHVYSVYAAHRCGSVGNTNLILLQVSAFRPSSEKPMHVISHIRTIDSSIQFSSVLSP